jgi:S-formylglutathione hydrolase FrmB
VFTSRLLRRSLLLALVLAAAAGSSAAAQEVQTWDMTTTLATKAEALTGLSAEQAAAEGPTGIRVRAVLPDGYTPTHCWPVLYLLHGTGSATAWVDQIDRLKALKAIVIIPGTGNTQYLDWYNGGKLHPAWERWFFEQLIPAVETRLPICAERRYHSIAGLSAGGGAAYYLASQEPQRFGSAGSFSGTLNFQRPEVPVAWPQFYDIFGGPSGFYVQGKNPLATIDGLRPTRLFMRYGNGQPNPGDPPIASAGFQVAAEIEMRSMSLDFLAQARKDKIAITASERTGMHNMTNWKQALSDMIAWDPFAPVIEAPKSWTVTTVRQQGVIWGYRYRFAKAPQAVEQFAFNDKRLRVTGKGRVKITPAGGKPITATLPFDLVGSRAIRISKSGTGVTGAKGRPGFTFKPLHPKRRQAIGVSWPNNHRPKAGHHLQMIAYQSGGTCETTQFTSITWHRGKRLSATIKPPARPGKGRSWCPGTVLLTLQDVPTGSSGVSIGTILRIGNVSLAKR